MVEGNGTQKAVGAENGSNGATDKTQATEPKITDAAAGTKSRVAADESEKEGPCGLPAKCAIL